MRKYDGHLVDAMQAHARSVQSARFTSTALMSEIAFGDSLHGSIAELDADIERAARRARWERRKAKR